MKKRNKKKAKSQQLDYAYWDKQLELSGFKDIEDRRTGRLKVWSGQIQIQRHTYPFFSVQSGYSSLVWKESQAEYYRAAGQLVFSARFKSKIHRNIWRLHADGFTQEEISRAVGLTERQIRYAISQMRIGFRLSEIDKKEATKGSNHAPLPDETTYTNKRCGTRRS